jgi:hypothetical protein
MSISSRARQNIQEVLPELRKLATQIEQTHKVEVLAVGKESLHALFRPANSPVNDA